MKKLQFLLLIFIIFLVPKTFCQDFNVSADKVSCPIGQGTGKYCGLENYLAGSSAVYNLGTRYNGRLGRIWFNLIAGGYADPDGFEKGHTYTLTMPMATDDWRNNFGSVSVKCEGSSGAELSNGRVSYISMKKIKFSFTTPSDYYCQFVLVNLLSTNQSSVSFTGVNNWQLNNFIITDPYYSSSGGSSGGGSATPTPTPSSSATNQDVIDNANANTQDIINNNNSNTQDVIDNATSNTQNIIDNNNANTTCPSGPLAIDFDNYVADRGKYLDSSGALQSSTSYGVSKYFLVKPDTEYKLKLMSSIASSVYYCLYRQNGNVIACYDLNTTEQTITTTSLTTYIRFTLRAGRVYYLTGPVCNDWNKEAQNDTTNAINDLNDSIKDDNIDSGVGSDFFDDFSENNHGLSGIITIPLNAIQNLTSNQCTTLQLPIPFTGKNITLPCMSEFYEEHIPTLYSLLQTIIYGFMAYRILIDIFAMVKGFKDPDNDKIEVLDL